MTDVFKKLGINKIVIASTNIAKIEQIKNFDVFKNVELLLLSDFNLGPVEETEDTLEGNALLKARYCYKCTGLPSLSDDSGFFVNALDGFPGVHCAKLAETLSKTGRRDYNMVAKVINDKLGDNANKSSMFSSVIVFVADGMEYIARGDTPGTFVYPAMNGTGINNGGYNPYFIPEDSAISYAQKGIVTEYFDNHRSIAVQNLIKKMELAISKAS